MRGDLAPGVDFESQGFHVISIFMAVVGRSCVGPERLRLFEDAPDTPARAAFFRDEVAEEGPETCEEWKGPLVSSTSLIPLTFGR